MSKEMKPPMRIWQCVDGHAICAGCRLGFRVRITITIAMAIRLTITMTMTCTIFSQGQAREQRMPLLLKVCFGLWLPFDFWFFCFHWFFHGQVDWWEELHSGKDGSVLVWGRHLLSKSPGLEIDFEAEQLWKKILLFVQKWANAIDIKCSLFVSNLNQCQLNLNLEYNSNKPVNQYKDVPR